MNLIYEHTATAPWDSPNLDWSRNDWAAFYNANGGADALRQVVEDLLERYDALDGYHISDFKPYLAAPRAASLIMLAEACNWAAKTVHMGFYGVKPILVDVACIEGARGWWNEDDFGNMVAYIYHPYCGTASFHDPNDEIIGIDFDDSWSRFRWSGVARQHDALRIMYHDDVRSWYAIATRPRTLLAPYVDAMDDVA